MNVELLILGLNGVKLNDSKIQKVEMEKLRSHNEFVKVPPKVPFPRESDLYIRPD